jgi:hypothetical protein
LEPHAIKAYDWQKKSKRWGWQRYLTSTTEFLRPLSILLGGLALFDSVTSAFKGLPCTAATVETVMSVSGAFAEL